MKTWRVIEDFNNKSVCQQAKNILIEAGFETFLNKRVTRNGFDIWYLFTTGEVSEARKVLIAAGLIGSGA